MTGGRAGFYRRLVTMTAGTFWTMMVLLNCGFCERARVTTTEDEYPVRLVGGESPSEGRVEVLFNGQWGTVSDMGWDPADASVVCRQLGLYGHNTSIDAAYFGQGTGPVLMANVQCNGSESRLTDCAFTGWGVTYSHAKDASVWCQIAEDFPVRIINGTSMRDGIVEIYFRGRWGRICDSNLHASSGSVICRELGFHGPNVSHMIRSKFRTNVQIHISNFVCNGDERALADCTHGWKTDVSLFACAVIVSCEIEDEAVLPVRLTGGLSSNQGRLEVYSNGVWVGVGREGWNDAATSVVCRQLDFFGPNVTMDGQFFGEDTEMQFVSSFDCKGDETILADCRITNQFAAVEGQTSVAIACQAVDDHPLRLVGGNSSRRGLVEVFFNGHWVVICGGDKVLDKRFAGAVCTQLGFSGKSFPAYGDFFTGEHHTLDKYARLKAPCRRNASRLVDCAQIIWGAFPCPSWRAGVLCEIDDVPVRLTDGSSSTEGRVEIFLNDQWAYICNDNWNASAASVVCRELGYPGRNFSFGVGHGYPPQTHIMHRVDCNGQERRLADCTISSFGEPCSHIAGVMCQSNEDFPVRLVGGTSSREGRVEILFDNKWGTVCDQNWDEADADIVCRQLGFYGASVALQDSFFGRGDGPVHMTNINCRGDEEELTECMFPAWGGVKSYYCRLHMSDAAVICESDEDFPIRLVGGQTSRSGRVELYFHGEWGTIGDLGWDAADARVVCRQLGFDGRSEAVAGPIFGPGQGYQYLDSLECFGNESRLFDCLRKEKISFRSIPFRHDNAAGVICQSDEPFALRLTDGFSQQSGRVEIFFNGKWGRICSLDWDIQDANVVCNQLGFNGAQASIYNSLFGSGSGPVYWNNFECVGNESVLADCTFTSWRDVSYCFQYAGVICNAGRWRATRNCSSNSSQGNAVQEDHERRSCGYLQNVSSLEDTSLVPTMAGNEYELSRLLAEMTSLTKADSSLSLRAIEELFGIVHSIVNLGAGEPQVTNAVIGAVNSIVSALRAEGSPEEIQTNNITSFTQIVEAQVSSSLCQNGQVSVQKENILVEAASLNFSQVKRGFDFAAFKSQLNVSNPKRSEPPRKGPAFVGLKVRIYQSTDDLPYDGVIAAVGVPENIVKVLQSENGNKTPSVVNVSFILYADDTLFPSARIKRTNSQNGSNVVIPGPVISLNVLGVELISLTELIVVEFQNVQAVSNIKKAECVSWDFSLESGLGDWSNAGCNLHAVTSDRFKCLCNHATNFAILVEVQEEELKMHRSLNPIVQISCFVSSSVYLIVVIMYVSVRNVRASISGKISLQLVFSLLILYLVFATAVENGKGSTYGCITVAALLQYLPLTAMTWTAVEAWNLYTATLTRTPQTACPYYMIASGLIAWGFPLTVTGITLAFGTDEYGRGNFCILASSLPMYLGLVLPLCVIFCHNVITFCAVIRLLRRTSREPPFWHLTARLGNDIVLCIFMGVTLASGFLSIHDTSDTSPVILCVANCIQVLAVCCMCLVNVIAGSEALVPLKRDHNEQADRSGEDSPAAAGNISISVIATPSPESGKDDKNEAI